MWLSTGVQPNWIQYEFDKAYKLDEMWVWNSNQLIEPSSASAPRTSRSSTRSTAAAWTELAEGVPEFAKATGRPPTPTTRPSISAASVAKYVKLTINSNWGGLPHDRLERGAVLLRPGPGPRAQPADAATGVDIDADLNWRPGREAASHKVYFGTDKDAVANGTAPARPCPEHSFSPATLSYGATYYWRVDEVNDAMVPAYEGEVWSFTTQEYAVVDDFESYTDDDNRIYEAWIDG
jgi:hypothetical protein